MKPVKYLPYEKKIPSPVRQAKRLVEDCLKEISHLNRIQNRINVKQSVKITGDNVSVGNINMTMSVAVNIVDKLYKMRDELSKIKTIEMRPGNYVTMEMPLQLATRHFQHKMVRLALEKTDNHREKAMDLLGIGRTTFYNILSEMLGENERKSVPYKAG